MSMEGIVLWEDQASAMKRNRRPKVIRCLRIWETGDEVFLLWRHSLRLSYRPVAGWDFSTRSRNLEVFLWNQLGKSQPCSTLRVKASYLRLIRVKKDGTCRTVERFIIARSPFWS
jgi:hypothetical protein